MPSLGKGSEPAMSAIAVTPSDTTDLATPARAMYVGTSSDLSIITPDGVTVLFASVPSGFILPVAAIRVRATATTATNVVALY